MVRSKQEVYQIKNPFYNRQVILFKPMDTVIPPKRLIARTFSKRASRYRETAFVQRRIVKRLARLIQKNMPSAALSWLDAGCGSGLLGILLEEKKIPLTLFQTDFALDTLKKLPPARPLAVQSDIEEMPFKNSAFGGVVSSSVFQWLDDAEKSAREICRVLVMDGSLFFSVFLENAFSQLVALRRKRGLNFPVRLFRLEEFTGLLKDAGFSDIKTETLHEEYYFPTGRDALKFLNDIGSTAVSGKRLGRSELFSLYRDYEDSFSTTVGVPLTVHIAYGSARKGK
jgi:SAM-dependent methyltransferase